MAKANKSTTPTATPKSISEYELIACVKNVRASLAGDLTQTSNGKLLVAMYSSQIRYNHSARQWWVWDTIQWLEDAGGVMARAAKRVVERLLEIAAAQKDSDRRGAIQAWARRGQSAAQQDAILKQARSEPGIAIRSEDFDRDPWLLGLRNGTLELRTCLFRPSRPEDYISRVCGVSYDPTAQCPHWCALLELVQPSANVRRYLQKLFGVALTGDTSIQGLHILHGAGANAKTTIVQTVAQVLGDYALDTPITTLLSRDRSGGVPNDLARLKGARFVYASEPGMSKALAEALLKLMTGGDQITARFLFREFFSFVPEFKLVILANHKPDVAAEDDAMWRRLRLIPFLVTIPPDKRDEHFKEQKLVPELPGILNWVLDGLKAWQQEGLEVPPEIADATALYRRECDDIGEFLDNNTEVDPRGFVLKADLHDRYSRYHDGEPPLKKAEFGRRLKARGFLDASTGDARIWKGLRLKGD